MLVEAVVMFWWEKYSECSTWFWTVDYFFKYF